MKWNEPTRNFMASTCGRYIVNWNDPRTQFMAVRLGKPRKDLWDGSVCLRVGTKAECVEACEGMPVSSYYNEIDPHAAQWLRNLISAGVIAPGDVDERSIEDVRPDDLRGYTQCHFFAGIGGWAYALDLAGWPRDRPVWTGSCPCQPFSAAGKGAGFADERHLWPAWQHLIAQLKPPVVFGEQVEGSIRKGWLDRVVSDLEGGGYACGAAVLQASGANAPHKRDRLWFVAHSERDEQSRAQSCCRALGRVGGQLQPVSWDGDWEGAFAAFRALDDGLPRCLAGTDAARNAIVPQVAAQFVSAYLDWTEVALEAAA